MQECIVCVCLMSMQNDNETNVRMHIKCDTTRVQFLTW